MSEQEIYSDIMDELSVNFLSYAAAVNTDRAIPDSKSGLKPVARRILYDMYDLRIVHNKGFKKCAYIVGDVMGRFHPHGDTSIYGALVRLAQPWVMRYPLIDFHGNNGGLGNDGAAAMRYTEARLSKLSEQAMLDGVKARVVDFVPNYSEDDEEPVTLVSLFPNLLCNPNTGIGVALACNWLPHNLTEASNAILAYLDDENISYEGLLEIMPGPDYPLGGRIINQKNMLSCYKTGRGRVITQARYELETRLGKQLIVFKELPFGVNVETLLDEINKLYIDGSLTGINTVRDESDKDGLRIVLELNKDGNVGSVVTKLYAKTKLQANESFNQVALVDKVPTLLNLKQVLSIYTAHQTEILIRQTEFSLAKARTRLNIVEGMLVALEDIDNVIALIKASKSAADARVQLAAKYNLNEEQSKAIVDMKLGKLAGLEKVEVQTECNALNASIEGWNTLLEDPIEQRVALKAKIIEMRDTFGDARRTEITHVDIKPEEKIIEAIEPEDVVVALTKGGHIKRIPVNSFKIQKRNGKGVKTKDDSVIDIIKTNTIDTLVMFSTLGKMYRIVVDDVPATTNAGIGTIIGSLVKLAPQEEIIAITSLYRKSEATSVVFATANGMIKKSSLDEYSSGKRTTTGVIALKLKEGDSVVDITFLKDQELILISREGMAIRVSTDDIANVGRVTLGVKGMKLNETDAVVAAVPVHKLTDSLAIFTKSGLAKKVALAEFVKQGRNGKGVVCYKNEVVAGAAMVDDSDNILIVGSTSNIGISAKDIPTMSRTASGNSMIKNSLIMSVVKI